MNSEQLLEDRELRETCIERFDVLEKVKKLLLISGTELATVQQVAEFYEVGVKAIHSACEDHKDELIEDGLEVKGYKEFSNLLQGDLKTQRGKAILSFPTGEILEIPTRGLRVFPRRAILRIGMLLRDSVIAKEVRTQLLNIEERASNDTKVADIDEEQALVQALGTAYYSGTEEEIRMAHAKMLAFKNRHIEKLKEDKRGLAGEILRWDDRSKLNAGIRMLSSKSGVSFAFLWNELYKNLQYKYHINLKTRNEGKQPYINNAKQEDWEMIIKTFCAMCESYNMSPSEMFQQTLSVYQPENEMV